MSALPQILEHRLVAILRGLKPDNVLAVAEALEAGGIRLLEITMNSDNALELIESLSEKFESRLLIGAGTVLDAATAEEVIKAGARFIISPSFDANVVDKTKALGITSIPGAFTPTEIVNAHRAGADIVKIFPAPNAQYIRDLRGPLPHIRMMPTGGVKLETIRDFHAAGAVAFGLGTALVDPKKDLTDKYLDDITKKASMLNNAINSPIEQ